MFWDRPTIRQFLREQGGWPELRARNGELRTAIVSRAPHLDDPATLAEIERRRGRWLNPREDNRPPMPMAIDILLMGETMGIISLIAEKRALQVALLIALLLLLVRICIVVRRRQRVEEALLDGLCPDCGYECGLDGAGPPVCPECGAAWPLVPPDPAARRAADAADSPCVL